MNINEAFKLMDKWIEWKRNDKIDNLKMSDYPEIINLQVNKSKK